jgi:hypothetical protein
VTTMEGQRVVIVGGTSGIGLATVRATAALGAEVVAAGRRPLAQRESIPGVQAADVDITDHESVQRQPWVSSTTSWGDCLIRQAGRVHGSRPSDGPLVHGRQVLRQLDLCPVCHPPPASCGVDHLRDRRGGGATTRPRLDDHGRPRRPRSPDPRPGDRARPAARQRHPTRLHRQRHVVVPAPDEARRAGAGVSPRRCRSSAWTRPTTSPTPRCSS